MPNSRACRTSSSRPVWRGSSPASCSATPIRRRAASGSAATSTPATRAVPEVIVIERRQHPHGRRLAGAVGPEEAEDLAGLDPQVDAAHRLDDARPAAVVLDQPLGLHGYVQVLLLAKSSLRARGRPMRARKLIASGLVRKYGA